MLAGFKEMLQAGSASTVEKSLKSLFSISEQDLENALVRNLEKLTQSDLKPEDIESVKQFLQSKMLLELQESNPGVKKQIELIKAKHGIQSVKI